MKISITITDANPDQLQAIIDAEENALIVQELKGQLSGNSGELVDKKE